MSNIKKDLSGSEARYEPPPSLIKTRTSVRLSANQAHPAQKKTSSFKFSETTTTTNRTTLQLRITAPRYFGSSDKSSIVSRCRLLITCSTRARLDMQFSKSSTKQTPLATDWRKFKMLDKILRSLERWLSLWILRHTGRKNIRCVRNCAHLTEMQKCCRSSRKYQRCLWRRPLRIP